MPGTVTELIRNFQTQHTESDEWSSRVDLAAAFHLAVENGLNEGIDNHFTLMVPGHEDRFLLSPYGLHWSEVTPERLMIVNDRGARVAGEGFIDPSAHLIHWPVHAALGDRARCVMHTHMPYATALTGLENNRLAMAHQNSLRFFGKVAYLDEYDGLVFDESQGNPLGDAFGNACVLFMAHHGVLVVGRSAAEAFHRLYFLERACMVQVLAMSSGSPLRPVPDDVARRAVQEFDEWDERAGPAHFAALKRCLARKEGSSWLASNR